MPQNVQIENGDHKSQLEGWFELNKSKHKDHSQQFTFDEIPKYYFWSTKGGKCQWKRYTHPRMKNIVRVKTVSPRYLQTFSVRLLTRHQRGCTSFKDLRTGTIEYHRV